jgi:hypothetical protein
VPLASTIALAMVVLAPAGTGEPIVPEPSAPVSGPALATGLRWHAPPGCPDTETVRAGIERRLGRTWPADDLAVDATLVASSPGSDTAPTRFTLELELRRGATVDRRTVSGPSCDALATAAALVVALAIDAVAVARVVVMPPSPDATPPWDRSRVPAAIPRPPRIAPPTARRRFVPGMHLRTQGGIEYGALPGVGGHAGLAVAIAWPRLRIEMLGQYHAPRRAIRSLGRVDVQMGVVAIDVCARLRAAKRIETPVCAGIEAGAMRGDGADAPSARTSHGAWIAPRFGAGLIGWVRPRIGLALRAEGAIPLQRPRFELRGPPEPIELFAPAPASLRVLAGIEWVLVPVTERDRAGERG